MIIVIYLVRRTRFRPHFGVLTMVLLYLFCAARLLLPLEFPPHSDCERQRRVSAHLQLSDAQA